MSNSKKPKMLLMLVVSTAAVAAVFFIWGRTHKSAERSSVEPASQSMSAPEREALEVARNIDNLKSLKSSVNLMQKKNEVRTAVEVATMSKGKTIDEAAFEEAWRKISTSDQQSKSVDELAVVIAAAAGR
jgi:hypothetical protein